MKVKELIEKLSEFDPEVNVLHTVHDGFSEDDIYMAFVLHRTYSQTW